MQPTEHIDKMHSEHPTHRTCKHVQYTPGENPRCALSNNPITDLDKECEVKK